MDFPIDFSLFLALTGFKSGNYGLWEVDDAGIRSTWKPTAHSAYDEFIAREVIADQALSWPILASRLLGWQEKVEDVLPPWCSRIVSSELPAVEVILRRVEASLGRKKIKAAKKITAAKMEARGSIGKSKRVAAAEMEFNEVMMGLEAVNMVRARINFGIDGGKGSRSMLLSEITLEDVMSWFRAQSGTSIAAKVGFRATDEGLLYRNEDEAWEPLPKESVRRALKRWKESPAPTKSRRVGLVVKAAIGALTAVNGS